MHRSVLEFLLQMHDGNCSPWRIRFRTPLSPCHNSHRAFETEMELLYSPMHRGNCDKPNISACMSWLSVFDEVWRQSSRWRNLIACDGPSTAACAISRPATSPNVCCTTTTSTTTTLLTSPGRHQWRHVPSRDRRPRRVSPNTVVLRQFALRPAWSSTP